MTTTTALYAGTCQDCGGKIRPGDTIVLFASSGWKHDKCPPGKLDLVREVCGECFTEKSVSGACACEAIS